MIIHILHLGKLYPPDRGGIETVTEGLARAAASVGYKISVLALGRTEHASKMQDGVEVIRVSEGLNIKSQALSVPYLLRAIPLSLRADIVHIHWPNALAGLAAFFIPKSKKVVVHWHSDIVDKGVFYKLVKPIERAMLRRADRVICTTENYARASIPLRDFADKTSHIPLFIPDPREERDCIVPTLSKTLSDFVKGRLIALSVGRLVPYKGYSGYLDAIAAAEADLAFVIVGAGPLEAELKAKIKRLNLLDRVLMIKNVSKEELDTLRRHAHLYCMASIYRSEAFGVVLIEAMAEGLPIIATNINGSGVSWVNAHNVSGLNVDPEDIEALCATIDRLSTPNAEYKRLAKGARERFKTTFSEDVIQDQYLALYRSLAHSV